MQHYVLHVDVIADAMTLSASANDCGAFYRPQVTGMSMTYVVVNQPY